MGNKWPGAGAVDRPARKRRCSGQKEPRCPKPDTCAPPVDSPPTRSTDHRVVGGGSYGFPSSDLPSLEKRGGGFVRSPGSRPNSSARKRLSAGTTTSLRGLTSAVVHAFEGEIIGQVDGSGANYSRRVTTTSAPTVSSKCSRAPAAAPFTTTACGGAAADRVRTCRHSPARVAHRRAPRSWEPCRL